LEFCHEKQSVRVDDVYDRRPGLNGKHQRIGSTFEIEEI
jgi:hypothetical protein